MGTVVKVPPLLPYVSKEGTKKRIYKKRKEGERSNKGKISAEFTKEQIVKEPGVFIAACRETAGDLRRKSDESWKNYLGFKVLADAARVHEIYAEALINDKSLDWAEGKIEGEKLDLSELDDDTPWIQIIEQLRGLFS